MDLSELNVFLAVARERSFSRAAQKLYRTQPAVSITIRKLEDEGGEPLFPPRAPRPGAPPAAAGPLSGSPDPTPTLGEKTGGAVDALGSGGRGELSLGVN